MCHKSHYRMDFLVLLPAEVWCPLTKASCRVSMSERPARIDRCDACGNFQPTTHRRILGLANWDNGAYNVITRYWLSMKVELVRIGNSRGIRIPKPILEQCGFESTVELRVENDRLIIAKRRAPREGWEEAFRAASSTPEKGLLLDGLPANQFDHEEWQW